MIPPKSGGIGLVEEEMVRFSLTHEILWLRDQSRATPLWALPHHMSAPCKFWCPYVFWRKKYFSFSLLCDLKWPGGQRDMWLYGCVHLTISHQLAKSHDHRPCKRWYFASIICHVTTHHHVTSYNHVVKGSCEIIGEFSSLQVTILQVWWSQTLCKRRYFVFSLQSLVITELLEEEILSFQFVTLPHVTTWSEGHVT